MSQLRRLWCEPVAYPRSLQILKSRTSRPFARRIFMSELNLWILKFFHTHMNFEVPKEAWQLVLANAIDKVNGFLSEINVIF